MVKKFKFKDLIVTALLAVVGIIIGMLSGILAISPHGKLFVTIVNALFSGITFYLVAAKTKSPLMLAIYCIIVSLYGFYLPMILMGLVASVVVYGLTAKGRINKNVYLIIGYILFTCLGSFGGGYFPFLFAADQMVPQMMEYYGSTYMNTFLAFMTPLGITMLMIATAVAAFIGALIAKKLLKKHFQKAGMV